MAILTISPRPAARIHRVFTTRPNILAARDIDPCSDIGQVLCVFEIGWLTPESVRGAFLETSSLYGVDVTTLTQHQRILDQFEVLVDECLTTGLLDERFI